MGIHLEHNSCNENSYFRTSSGAGFSRRKNVKALQTVFPEVCLIDCSFQMKFLTVATWWHRFGINFSLCFLVHNISHFICAFTSMHLTNKSIYSKGIILCLMVIFAKTCKETNIFFVLHHQLKRLYFPLASKSTYNVASCKCMNPNNCRGTLFNICYIV